MKRTLLSLIYDAFLLYPCSLMRINNIYLHHTKMTLENIHVHTLQERYGICLHTMDIWFVVSRLYKKKLKTWFTK